MCLALTGCNKDSDYEIAPLGSLAPPEWAIGVWETTDADAEVAGFTITSDNVILDLRDEKLNIGEFYARFDETATFKVKEFKKNKSNYEIGYHSIAENNAISIHSGHNFKKGDGFIEVADYNLEGSKWNNYVKYKRKTE
jgi:hypothetical protein